MSRIKMIKSHLHIERFGEQEDDGDGDENIILQTLDMQRQELIEVLNCYSVVGLVLPRGEEQISGPSALLKSKKPSKRSQKGPRSCQKYSKLCYDHFGGRLEASNPPPLFTLSQSEGY